jgi:hypothetical protein
LDKTSVFSKTGKGALRLKHKSHALPQALVRVLALIDGKTTLAGLTETSKLGEVELYTAVKILTDEGFIREVVVSVVVATPFTVRRRDVSMVEGDLDFTHSLGASSSPFKSKE